jgi:prepilin-type N-terminal cleavage/methylation domain
LNLFLRRLSRFQSRVGVTLLEVVVTVAILGILASVIVLGVEASSRIGGEEKRADDAAAVLARLRDAAVGYNLAIRAGNPDTSFFMKTAPLAMIFGGINPGRLSQLTTKITTTDLNSCGYAYATATYTNRWTRAFYPYPINSSTPIRIADGYYANDVLQRFDSNGVAKTFARNAGADTANAPGTLAIVMPNVSLSDAQALERRMEGDHNPTSNQSIIRYTTNGSAPVTVFYHMEIHGC